MTEQSDPRLGSMLDGRYRLDERLAAGGMGVVYKSMQVALGKPVAVKFLHDAFSAIPDLVKRFQREATAMSRLSHPHLVSVIDSGVAAGVPFLVMDYVAGPPLSQLLTAGALPAGRAVGLTRQILAGVKHAHDAGVLHRDLKPDNILVLADGEGDFVKLLDFGLAKVVHSNDTQLTNTGFAMGTPGYMSPEQARGTVADERSDLYSVGVILFELVTGRKPFVADSPLALLRMHMDEAPPPPSVLVPGACSAPLEQVILRALAKDPAARWATAGDFAQALARTPEAAGPTPPALEPSVPRGAPKPALGGRLAAAAALLVLLGGGAALFTLARRTPKVQPAAVEAPIARVAPIKPAAMKAAMGATAGNPAAVKAAAEVAPARAQAGDDEDEDDERVEEPVAPSDTPGAQLEAAPAHVVARARPVTTKEAARLLESGHVDEAIQLLYEVRRHSPHHAGAALLLGHAYFRKLWRTDGLREYDSAIKLEPSLKHNGQLGRNAVAALDDPTYRLARAVIRARLGSAALPELKRAARSAKNARLQKRAARLVAQLSHGHHR